jgi:NADPH:quinone reductase
MKAIRVHELGLPDVLKLEEIEDLKPDATQVLVKVKAVGVNPVEAYVRTGGYARKPNLPYTPGTDAAGVVEEVGTGVTGFNTGDRVYTSGTITGAYAEMAICAEHQVHLLPDNVSFKQGAALGVPYATACYALFYKARAMAGETVLVHGGSGGVGIAAVQLALAAGLTVIATGGSPEGRKLIETQGAQHVLDHRAPGYLDALKEITGNHGPDVILEMLANVNLENDLEALAARGRIVVIGSRGKIEIDPRQLMSRNAEISGMVLFNANEAELRSIHATLAAGLKNKTLKPVVRRELPLKNAAQAHTAIMEPGALGKIVLVPEN